MDFRHFRFVMVILIVVLTIGVGCVTAAGVGRGLPQEVRLDPDTSSNETEYGRSVAIDGNLVAVGMGGDGAIGSVYVYQRMGSSYVLDEKLVFPEEVPCACLEAEDPDNAFGKCPEFGRTVAIQGNTIFVGARFAPVGDISAGAVYVFRNYEDSWQYNGEKIISPDPVGGDNFGRALAIQGDLLVVTARKNDAEKGAAYAFKNTSDGWINTATLVASDSVDGDYFGQSIALKGETLVIGARNAGPDGAGALYLYRKSGNDWIEVTKVTPEDGEPDEQYGFCIAVTGNTIAVGARRDNLTATKAGAVYVYTLNGNSVELVTILTAGDAKKGDEFGQSVAFAGDILAIGAWKDDEGKGSIYLFRQIDSQWVQIDKIQASDGKPGAGKIPGDEFGYSLAALGNRLVTGAHKADFVYKDAGAAYVIPVRL
ncbi:MAG: hypothetical protein KA094_03030 [Methanoregulaceae archaeon]|jgi:hypothetical protein|nr:hypothetical protein [Methanoregulaceae archaeon]MCC7468599.1 hypothetical protein [Burkholderiaceae bacterium]NLH24959.1 hypothetical protein [Methanomicrobiales archaeon]HMZ30936.1 hypothetical protein [Methanoregulaceae archaeon]HNO07680.1 hypothetical protein [Methanoregulaceae archaeon]